MRELISVLPFAALGIHRNYGGDREQASINSSWTIIMRSYPLKRSVGQAWFRTGSIYSVITRIRTVRDRQRLRLRNDKRMMWMAPAHGIQVPG